MLYEMLLEARKMIAKDNHAAPYFPILTIHFFFPTVFIFPAITIFILIILFSLHRYAICSDQVLRNIAKYRPSTPENLSLVDGVNLVMFFHDYMYITYNY